MLKISIGGLYLPSAADHVRRALALQSDGSEPPAILDIGTGSGERLPLKRAAGTDSAYCLQGSWAIDMAEEFPRANVLGIDVVPPNLARQVRRNVKRWH